MLSVFSIVLFLVAGADGLCLLFGVSLTGTTWSPLVFLLLGLVLCALEAPQGDRRSL